MSGERQVQIGKLGLVNRGHETQKEGYNFILTSSRSCYPFLNWRLIQENEDKKTFKKYSHDWLVIYVSF